MKNGEISVYIKYIANETYIYIIFSVRASASYSRIPTSRKIFWHQIVRDDLLVSPP